jgi:SagB-type dehydrogenase family enzyme
MGQLLMEEAPRHDLGLCPIGGLRFDAIRDHFGLEGTDELIHILAGGAIPGPSTSLRDGWQEEQGAAELDEAGDNQAEAAAASALQESTAIGDRPDWRARAITDPLARLEFKLSQHGLPLRDPMAQEVALPAPAVDEDLVCRFSERRSCRHFEEAEVPLAQFGAWLACLNSVQTEGVPLPKYRYPSGGGLYPVQSYLYVKPGRIEGIAGGSYYHDPVGHRLIRLQEGAIFDRGIHGPVNQTIFDGSAFTLFLVAPMSAVAPMYPELAEDFCHLEAGYMGQLLMTEGAEHRIGLTPVGGVEFEQVRGAFQLADDHRLVHLFEGGPIAAGPAGVADIVKDQNPPPSKIQQKAQVPTATASTPSKAAVQGPPVTISVEELKAFLGEKLPHYMVPPTVIFIDEIPLSANGKVNRKALPAAEHPPEVKERVEPRNDLEQQLAELVAEVLGTESIGIHDNFFELGATSVQIIQIQRLIKLRLEREVEMTLLFRQPTVIHLAQSLSGLTDDQERVDVGVERAQRRKEAGRTRRRRSRDGGDHHE